MQFDHESASVPLRESERDRLLLDMYGRVVKVEAKVEALPDLEDRVRKLERRQWGLPASIFTALLALVGIHHS